MIEPLALGVTLTALVTAGVIVVGGQRRYLPALAVLQLAIVVQTVADVVGLARGHRPAQFATHLAYLVTTLVVLPVAWLQAGRDEGRWATLLVAGALIVVAVLTVRLQTTWRSA